MPCGVEYPFVQFGSPVTVVSPPIVPGIPSMAVQKSEKALVLLVLCKLCSAVTKTFPYYQHCVQHKSRTQPHTVHCEENYPNWNQQGYLIISGWKPASQRTKWLVCMWKGKMWKLCWPKLPWKNSRLCWIVWWQFILSQQRQGNTVENWQLLPALYSISVPKIEWEVIKQH